MGFVHTGRGVVEIPARALERADFDDMAELESHYYGWDLITPAQESWEWFVRHPYTLVAARGQDGTIAGFVNLFPVHDDIYRAILSGEFNDANLTASDVEDLGVWRGEEPPERRLHMFLSCIVVGEDWRGGVLSRLLLQAAVDQFDDVARLVEDVAVDTATPAGERLAQRLGFAFVCDSDHGTRVWARDYAGFTAAVRG